jgi:predicted TIM-barrel enzyme
MAVNKPLVITPAGCSREAYSAQSQIGWRECRDQTGQNVGGILGGEEARKEPDCSQEIGDRRET